MIQSPRFRRPLVVSILTVSSFCVSACSGQGGPSNGPEAQSSAAAEVAPDDAVDAPDELAEDKVFVRILRESLKDVNLRPDQQQQVRAIHADLQVKTRPVREARHAVALTLAEGIESGQIDDAKLGAEIEKLAVEVDKAKPALQEALNALHRTLDADQRRTLLRGMRSRGLALRDKVQSRGGPRGVVRARLGRLADELELTDAQRVAIRDRARDEFRGTADAWSPGKRRDRRERMQEIGRAFATDQFDAKTLDVGKQGPEATRKIAGAFVRFAKVLVPELDDGQRAKLAERVRQRAARAANPPAWE